MTKHPKSMMYGTAWKKDQTSGLVEKALQSGFRAIDTANQPKHYNEPAVGEALERLKASVPRDEIFLQTKFTPLDGHDQRVPYNPESPLKEQVRQSFLSSLEHLNTTWIDSYLLHGPYGYQSLDERDFEVWAEIESIYESGKAKAIGISNINAHQLTQLIGTAKVKPHYVQNRCYANRAWDHSVRAICKQHDIIYQGFSLLTANRNLWQSEALSKLAEKHDATTAQIIFRFCQLRGMLPLTGTTDPAHMQQDLASERLALSEDELSAIEFLEVAD